MRTNRSSARFESSCLLEISEALFTFNWVAVEEDLDPLEGPRDSYEYLKTIIQERKWEECSEFDV